MSRLINICFLVNGSTVSSDGSVVVNYAVTVPKDDAAAVDDVVTAIKKSNDTFAGSDVGSVGKSGKSLLFYPRTNFINSSTMFDVFTTTNEF